MRIVVSDKAKADLLQIYRYLDDHSPSAAQKLIRRIDANFENLRRFPFIGRERSSLTPGLRCLVVGIHLVFYTVEPDRLVIIRVIDGRMDVDEEFRR
jgi:toxin ParE1/3/4